MTLPPGQIARDDFPRFGLSQFAKRFPHETKDIVLSVTGAMEPITLTRADLVTLPQISQTSDFHCVTTWSHLSLKWHGVRFADFFERFVKPHGGDPNGMVIFRCQDGFRARLPLEDLLSDDVLLATQLDDAPLTIEHGAPIRLIAPAHYGYKNAKHVDRIEFGADPSAFKGPTPQFMEHPRARVALEERGSYIPGRILRFLYRPLVRSTVRQFRQAMDER